MLWKKFYLVFILFVLFSFIFFNKTFLKGEIPFPGDLLVGDYFPYNSYSVLGFAPGGYPHKAQNIDVVEQLYPWKYFSIEMLKKGEIPLWNPYNFSGTPHLAAIQSGTFYPFNILFFIFPFVPAWSIYIILQPILAGVFTYLFLKHIKLEDKSSVFGGLVFSFSSFLVVWMQYGNIIHAALWLPLVLYLGLKNLESPSFLKSVLLSLALSMSIFAGHFQIALYLYGFSFIFLLSSAIKLYRKEIFSKILLLIVSFGLSVLISAVQIFPSIEIFINSSRTNYTYERLIEFLIPTYHLAGMLFPDFFGNPVSRNYWLTGTYIERVSYFGIIPLFFVIYALFSKKNFYVWFFAISAVCVFFITFDSFVTKFVYSIFIPPIIATSVPTRIMFIFIFSLSVLSAFGFTQISNLKEKTLYLKSIGVTILIVSLLFIAVFFFPGLINNMSSENQSIALRNMIVPLGVLTSALITITLYKLFGTKLNINKAANLLVVFIFALTIFELYFFFQKFSPFAPKETIYPQNEALEFIKDNQQMYRTWGYGGANLRANIHTYEKIYSTDGYDPFYIRRYGELMSSTENGTVPQGIQRANATLANGFGENNLKENVFRQKMMNLLGVKYILHKKDIDNHAFDKTFDETNYSLVWFGDGLQIYENKNVLPRAFLVSDYEVLGDEKKIIDRLYSPEFDIREKVILEKPLNLDLGETTSTGSVEITQYNENEVRIKVRAEDDALLFISDAFFPEWNAYIDGQKTEVMRADYAFRAVLTPKGEHVIVYKYEPKSFETGKWITIASMIAVCAVLVINRKKK